MTHDMHFPYYFYTGNTTGRQHTPTTCIYMSHWCTRGN